MRFRLIILLAVFSALSAGLIQGQSLTLDHVDGLNTTGGLKMGVPVTFFVRMTGDENYYGGATNGYRVYSPTGAQWTTTVADTTGALTASIYEQQYVKHFSVTGSGADTVGLGCWRQLNSTGLPVDFDDVVFEIQIGPIDQTYDGGQICLDSSYYTPSGVWKWAGPDAFPAWDGPHCFTIGELPGDPPVIVCPTEAYPDVELCSVERVCVPLSITDYETVTVDMEGAEWDEGQLCFTPQLPGGPYTFHVVASNSAGSTDCYVNVNVFFIPQPSIACPPEPLDTALCGPQAEVCIDLEILNYGEVTVNDAEWAEGQLCFEADTVGTYTFHITATATDPMCEAVECDLTVVVDFIPEPMILCPESPIPDHLYGVGDACVILQIVNATDVYVEGATWENDELCFFADTSGSYDFDVTAEDDCGRQAFCQLTVEMVVTPPSEDDILTIPTVPAVPGSRVAIAVGIENLCSLDSVMAALGPGGEFEFLDLDSISWVGSVIEHWSNKEVIHENHKSTLVASASIGEDPVPAGKGTLVTFHLTVGHDAPESFCPIVFVDPPPVFRYDCGSGPVQVAPTAIDGGVVIGTAENYVCGYVVDPQGSAIEGATVELWSDFPRGFIDDMTYTDGTGLFEFFNSTIIPFDLWAYKDGYYPVRVEDLNFAQTGIMITLTTIEPVTPTPEWVNFYCPFSTYLGDALPVGSVIDAFAEGVHCGSFAVSEPGKYGFLLVYGDDPYTPEIDGAGQGDLIRFYVNGVEAIPSVPAFWTSKGDVYEVCLEAATPTVHSCDLAEGWNLVSWNIDQGNNNITEALASIEECLIVVLGYEAGGLTYDPTLPLFSTLNYVDYLSGYWIKVDCDITLEITGTAVPVTTPIPVTEGWNLVSYLPGETLATPIALASIHDDLIVALGADNVYQPGDPLNSLLEMDTCHGYWVKVAQGGQLIYPGPIPAPALQVRANLVAAKGVPGLIPTTRWMNLYAHELLLDGAPVPAGATITAHTGDGNLIGGFSMEQDGLFGFMPVYADDPATGVTEGARPGEEFHLRVNGVRTMEEFVWSDHAEKREINSLTSKSSSDGTLPSGCSLAQNYPNPFNPTTTISFSLPSAGRARIEIYNILGRLVAVPHDGMSSAGINQVVWNGRNSAGKPVSSGVYFYRLTADNYTETRKMTLLK